MGGMGRANSAAGGLPTRSTAGRKGRSVKPGPSQGAAYGPDAGRECRPMTR